MMKKSALSVILSLMMCGCLGLKDPVVQRYVPLKGYRYVMVNPTGEIYSYTSNTNSSESGSVSEYYTRYVCPAEVITGQMLKAGFVPVDAVKPEYAHQTLIVNYGESGRTSSTRIEVVVQILSASSDEILCLGTAEGRGATEADAVRNAINRPPGGHEQKLITAERGHEHLM